MTHTHLGSKMKDSYTVEPSAKKILFISTVGLYSLDAIISKAPFPSLVIVSRTVILSTSIAYLMFPGYNPIARLVNQLKTIQGRIKTLNKLAGEIGDLESAIKQEIKSKKEESQKIIKDASNVRVQIVKEAQAAATKYLQEIKDNYEELAINPQKIAFEQIIAELTEKKNTVISEIQRLDQTRTAVIEDIKAKQIIAQQEYEQNRAALEQQANQIIIREREKFQSVLDAKQAEINEILSENHVLRQQLEKAKAPILPETYGYAETYARSLIGLMQEKKIILHYKHAEFFSSEGLVSVTLRPDDPFVNSGSLKQYTTTIKNQLSLNSDPVITNEGANIRFKIMPSEFRAVPNEDMEMAKNSPQVPRISLNSNAQPVSKEEQERLDYFNFLQNFNPPNYLFDAFSEIITDEERNFVLYLKLVQKVSNKDRIITAVWKGKNGKPINTSRKSTTAYYAAVAKYDKIILAAQNEGFHVSI